MALSGTLETFSLPDVLRLLASTKKTGLLALDGDRGAGRLWVADGALVAADADRAVVDDVDAVLFELLRFADAAFEFDASAVPASTEGGRDVESALEVAGARLEEWREIEAVVPSLDVRVRMAAEVGAAVTVEPEVWRLLACVGTGAGGHDVARALGQGEYEVCRALRDLVERELVEVELVEATHEAPATAPAAEPEPPVAVTDAFAAMVSAPDPDAVPVYEVPEAPAADPVEAFEPTTTDVVADDAAPDVADPADPAPTEDVEVGAPAVDEEPLPDLALLSPRAAAAVEATWSGDTSAADEEPEHAPAGQADGDELDQNLLLRFLSSAKH